MNKIVKNLLIGSALVLQVGAAMAGQTNGVTITGITVAEGIYQVKFGSNVGTNCIGNNVGDFSESYTAGNLSLVKQLAQQALTTGRTVNVYTDDSSCISQFPVTIQKIRSLTLN